MPGIRVNEVENGGHKRESNYELESENGGWEEDESQLKKGGLHYRCGKDSKKGTLEPRESNSGSF